MIPGVSVDMVSMLKSVQGLSERAIEDFRIYQKAHNPSHLAHAASCLREINEFFGDGKLGMMVMMLDMMAKQK